MPTFKVIQQFDEQASAEAKELVTPKFNVITESCLAKMDLEVCSLLEKIGGDVKNGKSRETEAKPQDSNVETTNSKASEVLKETAHAFSNLSKATAYALDFGEDPKTWPREAKDTNSYPIFLKAKSEHDAKMRELTKDLGLFSRGNFTPLTLVKAVFTHADWTHLISNLIFLLIFGMAVEQRIGFARTFLVFLFGSFLGLSIQAVYSPQVTLGASAGITALMGAFFIFFYKADMKFVFTFGFVYYRSFYFRVLWTLPIFYFVHDFTFASGNDSEIAHVAHLGGLLFGFAFAFWNRRAEPLEAPFLYHQEKRVFDEYQKKPLIAQEMWPLLNEGMTWNVQNRLFLERFMQSADKAKLKISNSEAWQLAHWYQHYFRRMVHHQDLEAQSQFLDQIRDLLKLEVLLELLSWQSVLELADHCTHQARYELALKLYNYALPKVTQPKTKELVTATCQKIQEKIQETKIGEPINEFSKSAQSN